VPNKAYRWDKYSDQPAIIRDKSFKKKLYQQGALGTIKTFFTGMLLPFIAVIVFIVKSHVKTANPFGVGLCVNPDTPLPEKKPVDLVNYKGYIDELNVEHILIRVPLSDIENLDTYVEFATALQPKALLINVLQDRHHIENPTLLIQSLRSIFSSFASLTKTFQIGNSVNRRKWAFITIDEYFNFFQKAQTIRDKEFPEIKLLGGNIIDFELPNFARSLINFYPIKYDGYSAQLYVDRRGSPENTQFGLNFLKKLKWFGTLIKLSKKCTNQLWITETNWPLIGTEPFAH